MEELRIGSEAELSALMEEINAELIRADVPIPQRPFQGWFLISKRHRLGLRFPPQRKKAKENSFEGDDLTIRIFDWFDAEYGGRLKIDHSPGHTITVVRGEGLSPAEGDSVPHWT
jgi:hypothetical protein